MRRGKGSRRIVVNECEYRWRATGDDGVINIGVWPANNVGPYISGTIRYHETWIPKGDGSSSSAGDQVVVTSRIVRRVIEYATAVHGYDPNVKGSQLNLYSLDNLILLTDEVRASHPNHHHSPEGTS
jgi:hypothetical protein